MPSEGVVNALAMACLRGVEVTILIPRMNDNLFVKNATLNFVTPLEKKGVRFFYYEKGFIH